MDVFAFREELRGSGVEITSSPSSSWYMRSSVIATSRILSSTAGGTPFSFRGRRARVGSA